MRHCPNYALREAVPYRNADICNAAIANLEALYVLAHLNDFTDSLVPRNEWELSDKLSLVDMTISATDTTAGH